MKEIIEVYDPLFIDYKNELDEFDPQEEPSENKKKNYIMNAAKPLMEVFVDPGYELEMVSPKDKNYLDRLRIRFGTRGYEPIAFYDIKSAMYDISNKMGRHTSDFQITHIMRNLWRVGYVRRFVRGRVLYAKPGRGEWNGIHYILYPNKENDE